MIIRTVQELITPWMQSTRKFSATQSSLKAVICSIQRCHFEQVKVTIPVVLKVLKAILLESDDEETELGKLFDATIGIADSIHSVSVKLVRVSYFTSYQTIFRINNIFFRVLFLLLLTGRCNNWKALGSTWSIYSTNNGSCFS